MKKEIAIPGDLWELDRNDAVLKDVIPYVQDPFFIAIKLKEIRGAPNEVEYLEELIASSGPDRIGDLRILLNRLTKKTA